ncbi:MAG TPA: CopG family transcriptional regulator [Anaerolineales bacterium]
MVAGKKKPIQIYLREDQVEALRIVAERRGESIAALVREGVDRLLDELPPNEDPLLDIIGLYDSGQGDLAEKHDEYLARMIEEESGDGP